MCVADIVAPSQRRQAFCGFGYQMFRIWQLNGGAMGEEVTWTQRARRSSPVAPTLASSRLWTTFFRLYRFSVGSLRDARSDVRWASRHLEAGNYFERTDMSNPKFSIVPDQAELDALNRDLRFYSADPSQARKLDAAEVERYNEDGFLKNIPVFPADEIDEIREYFDQLVERVMAAGGDSYSISSAHMEYGRVYDILTDSRIVDPVADLLGHDVVGWGSHFFCKMPHDGKTVAWHQDASYWPLTPSRAVTVWLAIDDADRENACMRFVAGSHRHGHINYRSSEDGEQNVLNQTVEKPEEYGRIVDVEMRAGEISIHSDLLLHGSDANDSDRRRCGLTLRYSAAEVRAHLDWNQKGVVVAGSDPSGHWANRPRPTSE